MPRKKVDVNLDLQQEVCEKPKKQCKTPKTKATDRVETKSNTEKVVNNSTENIKSEKKNTKVVVESVKNKKSVMFVASEGLPFVKTGGLSDVIGALPKKLASLGEYDVSVIMPMYSKIDRGLRDNFTFIGNFNVGLSWRNLYCGLFSCRLENVTYYFIDNEYFFKRDSLYGHYDDGERFAFFGKAVLDSLGFLNYYPDVLHCNDWQSACTVIYLKTLYKNKFGFSQIKTVFTIHNIEYQGKYSLDIAQDLFGFSEQSKPYYEFDNCINLMKGAIELSDRVTAVSPSYANEIKYPYFAHGLENIMMFNQGKLSGILNGIDTELNNPQYDSSLFENYTADNMQGKAVCKRELQKMLGLPVHDDVAIVAVISRLVSHKGLDLIKGVLEELLSENIQFVVLGQGDAMYENYFKYMESRYSGKMKALITFNKDMASKLYSGADIFLMPSMQEPCGLSQMVACRYGTIPVVRKTGGLGDSITPFNTDRTNGNGFMFNNYNAHEMLYVIKDAIFTYNDKPTWNNIIKYAMNTDFSWDKSAKQYQLLYNNILGVDNE